MWESRRLTTLWAFTACNRDSITFYYFLSILTYLKFVTNGESKLLSRYSYLFSIAFWTLVVLSEFCRTLIVSQTVSSRQVFRDIACNNSAFPILPKTEAGKPVSLHITQKRMD
jgi:hypothetical protein